MIYGYICTEKPESQENQKTEIEGFAMRNGVAISRWIENTAEAGEGDIFVASDFSQLGRDPLQALDLLRHLLGAGVQVWIAKEGYKLGEDTSGKVLAFAFGISADVKRRMLSEQTREALACVKADGKKLGRPLGRRNSKPKLAGHANEVRRLLSAGYSQAEVARRLGVSRGTLGAFIDSVFSAPCQ